MNDSLEKKKKKKSRKKNQHFLNQLQAEFVVPIDFLFLIILTWQLGTSLHSKIIKKLIKKEEKIDFRNFYFFL